MRFPTMWYIRPAKAQTRLTLDTTICFAAKATHILVWNYKGKGDAQDGGNYQGLKGDALDGGNYQGLKGDALDRDTYPA